MAMIHEIRVKIEERQYEFSKHAIDQSIIRDISVVELEDAVAGRQIWPELSPPGVHQSRQAAAYTVQLSESATCQDHHSVPP